MMHRRSSEPTYVVAYHYLHARDFFNSKSRYLKNPSWLVYVDDDERIKGLSRGTKIYVLDSAHQLPKYECIMLEARIRQFNVIES